MRVSRDGDWMDSDGACKVCGGEIPHGHTDECDFFKLETQLTVAQARVKELEESEYQKENAVLANRNTTLKERIATLEQALSSKMTVCPFCLDTDFDAIGLKHHLTAGHCHPWNTTGPIWPVEQKSTALNNEKEGM